jgi:hypothetical protein
MIFQFLQKFQKNKTSFYLSSIVCSWSWGIANWPIGDGASDSNRTLKINVPDDSEEKIKDRSGEQKKKKSL